MHGQKKNFLNFEKVGIRQKHKEHCSAYFAVYNSVTKGQSTGFFKQASQPTAIEGYNNDW